MSGKRFLLLDFDGVIADSFHLAHGVAKKMCVYLTETEYRKTFNGNIHDSHDAIAASDHGDRCDHALDWLAEYGPEFRTYARAFDGMPELVKDFARTYTICIVSSSHDDLIQHFLGKYGLRDAVEGVYGVEANPKKDEKFKMIFSRYGTGPQESIFVTDTLGDVNEAASVSLSSIGVTWGFQDRETLAHGSPFAIIDAPQELPVAVEEYFSRAS